MYEYLTVHQEEEYHTGALWKQFGAKINMRLLLHTCHRSVKLQHMAALSGIALWVFFCFFLHFLHCLLSLPVMRSSHTAENHQAGGKSVESDRDRRQEKENIFGAMCCRSKTWQSHDQRHLIILELHCSFNPSERTIFYRGGGGETMSGWLTDREKSSN